MTRPSERCLVREFKARMCALEPGDVLAPLGSPVPPGYRILVLAREGDALTLSLPCEDLRIVADPKSPFRWLEEAETLVDSDESPHELIDLSTQVAKGEAGPLAVEYATLSEWARAFQVLGEDRIREIMGADTVLRRRIDATLFNSWLPTPNARIAASFELIFGRPLTEIEQANAIALVSCLARAVPVVEMVVLPSEDAAEAIRPQNTH